MKCLKHHDIGDFRYLLLDNGAIFCRENDPELEFNDASYEYEVDLDIDDNGYEQLSLFVIDDDIEIYPHYFQIPFQLDEIVELNKTFAGFAQQIKNSNQELH